MRRGYRALARRDPRARRVRSLAAAGKRGDECASGDRSLRLGCLTSHRRTRSDHCSPASFQGGVHCCLSRCNSGRFFVPMRGGFPAFLLAGARCLRAALSGEAARRQRDGQRARQRAVTRSPVTRAARGQRDGQRESSAKRKTGSGPAARSSLSNRRNAATHRHKKPDQITARKAAVNPSLFC